MAAQTLTWDNRNIIDNKMYNLGASYDGEYMHIFVAGTEVNT